MCLPTHQTIIPTTPGRLCGNLTTITHWDEYVEPTAGNSGVAYQCLVPGRSGLFEPSPWPTTVQVSDGMVTWQATQQVISGPTEPSPWPTTNPAFDARIRWIPVQMQSGGSPPSWPSSNTDPINDGTLRWRLSMVYKKITVYVNDPNGNQYVATTILTARPGGAYP